MDAASLYKSLDEPDRADHLWRYTSCKRVHPSGDLNDIPIAASPNVQLPFITVSVFLDGASPSDTSRLIARPLENRLKTITGVKSIRSNSSLSFARVFLEFEVGFDMAANEPSKFEWGDRRLSLIHI